MDISYIISKQLIGIYKVLENKERHFSNLCERSVSMDQKKADRLKEIIEAKKNKTASEGNKVKNEFEKKGQQQKAFRNKKGGGFFDK